MPLLDELGADLEAKFSKHSKIGFFISGGFDSTCLLLAASILKKSKNWENEFIAITVPRSDNSLMHANRIVTWINTLFLSNIDVIALGNPYAHHSLQVLNGCTGAKNRKIADLFLLADTAVPDQLQEYAPKRVESTDNIFYQPWFHKTKDYVVRLSLELGYPEIMTITHSCTESKTIRCNQCWQCKERAWAFECANIDDIGKM